MEGPKVSIISIFHNRQDTVKASVESLVNQNYSNLEIVLVDDNSDDKTLNVLEEFERSHNNVKVIHNYPNKGFTKSLIDLISEMDSKYIAIHGSGDLSLPERVSKQVDFLESNADAGVVTVGVTNREINNVFDVVNEITVKDLLKRNMINHGAVMFSRSKYLEVGGYRNVFRTRQDKDLWFRMAFVCKLYFLPDKLYTWVKQSSSISNNALVNPEPYLLSEYAKYLCLQRMNTGTDSLEEDEQFSLLMFNPATCLPYFYKNLKYNLFKRNFTDAKLNIQLISTLETNRLKYLILKILNKIL